jgi:hypothetical protein
LSQYWRAGYIIDKANELQNLEDHLQILLEISYKLSHKADFHERIERKRIPFWKIERHISLKEIINEGCYPIGNIDITSILNDSENIVSNVIDTVCIDKERTTEQKYKIIKYLEMKGYEYRFLPNNVYGYILSLKGKKFEIPNQYGIYYYIEVKLPDDITLYIIITTAGNIIIKKGGLDRILYFENRQLFSIIHKFFRYQKKDIKDLEEYEEYGDKIKEIINKGFSGEDINNLRSLFDNKYIEKIKRNWHEYIEKHPGSIYESLNDVIKVIEHIY